MTSTKFYQNWPGFVDDVTITFGLSGFTVRIVVHLENMNGKFYKVA